jgi:thiamine phosphate synthase YjbQ (UPF0047 family)
MNRKIKGYQGDNHKNRLQHARQLAFKRNLAHAQYLLLQIQIYILVLKGRLQSGEWFHVCITQPQRSLS